MDMKRLLKVLNPFIWLFNVMNYFGHLETWRGIYGDERDPYDFDSDVKYF